MEARVTVITLGVRDLERSQRFYESGLGFRAAPGSNPNIRFYQAGGVVLALFHRRGLAAEAGVPAKGEGFPGFSLARNEADRAAVDRTLAEAEAAGATVVHPAVAREWGGYSGYFTDPDGYLWEVAHNPFWTLDTEGQVRLDAPGA